MKMNLTSVRKMWKLICFKPNVGTYKIISDHHDPKFFCQTAVTELRLLIDKPAKIKYTQLVNIIRLLFIAMIVANKEDE